MNNQNIISATNENMDDIIKNNKAVVVDFFADWCQPCKVLSMVLNEIVDEYKDKVVFVKVNVDEQYELGKKYRILSLPTLLYFKNEELIHRTIGILSKEELIKVLEENVLN